MIPVDLLPILNKANVSMVAAPIGVSPVVVSCGGSKLSAVWNSLTTLTGPNVMIATSTRLTARLSDIRSALKARNPSFSSAIGSPCIEPEVSSSRTQGQRCSGFITNSSLPPPPKTLESVHKVHEGLQSRLSIIRMEASFTKVSAVRVRFSKSLASLRQRLSQANVRSTIQRLGRTSKPLA